ncbi:MAG TPA: cytochrome o ubiquinol oxidase subunit III [Candidatus Saccharimonadales bacterium]|nr:cytochrome o ubiquinol oxidase subunit III [Candidatus Saccharimonadales bacterium]
MTLDRRHQEMASKTTIGFWLYLMTDCVLFASLFATFAVLRSNTDGGPGGAELFSLPYVLAETLVLLTSSFTAGMAILAAQRKDKQLVLTWFAITCMLGLSFLALELSEFQGLVAEGNSFTRSAFLSAFFTLVGTHGLHITVGLLWMGVLMHQIHTRGLTPHTLRRMTLLGMFWHFLDVIWIFIFTIVYMLGAF